MNTFTIENDTNNIMSHASVAEADAVANAERFRSEVGLAKLAANWPGTRLVEIYNSLPGVTPVAKFKDRATGVARIWKAIQGLGDTTRVSSTKDAVSTPQASSDSTDDVDVTALDETTLSTPFDDTAADAAPTLADVASTDVAPTQRTTRAKRAPKAPRGTGTREGSKTAIVFALLKREGGATLKELMEATAWQPHSVRGFLSGTIGKKMGLTLTSAKSDSGERTYSLPA